MVEACACVRCRFPSAAPYNCRQAREGCIQGAFYGTWLLHVPLAGFKMAKSRMQRRSQSRAWAARSSCKLCSVRDLVVSLHRSASPLDLGKLRACIPRTGVPTREELGGRMTRHGDDGHGGSRGCEVVSWCGRFFACDRGYSKQVSCFVRLSLASRAWEKSRSAVHWLPRALAPWAVDQAYHLGVDVGLVDCYHKQRTLRW